MSGFSLGSRVLEDTVPGSLCGLFAEIDEVFGFNRLLAVAESFATRLSIT